MGCGAMRAMESANFSLDSWPKLKLADSFRGTLENIFRYGVFVMESIRGFCFSPGKQKPRIDLSWKSQTKVWIPSLSLHHDPFFIFTFFKYTPYTFTKY